MTDCTLHLYEDGNPAALARLAEPPTLRFTNHGAVGWVEVKLIVEEREQLRRLTDIAQRYEPTRYSIVGSAGSMQFAAKIMRSSMSILGATCDIEYLFELTSAIQGTGPGFCRSARQAGRRSYRQRPPL